MSEENGQQAEQQQEQAQPEAGKSEFQPIASQEEFNRLVGERINKVREKFADYDDLKAKVTAAEEASKSEAEKNADRISKAESDAAEARSEAARLRVAAKFGISDEDADLFLTGSDVDSLTKQAERLAARENDRKKGGNVSPREGGTPTANQSGDWLRDSLSRT